MYIAEILEYDLSYYEILHQIGMKDEDVLPFMEWAFGKVVSFDKRRWFIKWNRFHGKELRLTESPQTLEDWRALALCWSRFQATLLK